MSQAKYLIRLDDACHTSNLEKWQALENIFDEFSILPIVAVIPNNKDTTLFYSSHNNTFWEKIEAWQKKGWSIAMHGYEHKYHYVDKRKLLLPFYSRSEFAGLDLQQQKTKIQNSLDIFKKFNIEPKLWVAPSHSFDEVTLDALRDIVDFRIVSDGISFFPYSYKGFIFIPQQLWGFVPKNAGIWTICLHPDTMSFAEIDAFRDTILENSTSNIFISLEDVAVTSRPKLIMCHIFSFYFWSRYKLVTFLKSFFKFQ